MILCLNARDPFGHRKAETETQAKVNGSYFPVTRLYDHCSSEREGAFHRLETLELMDTPCRTRTHDPLLRSSESSCYQA